MRPTTPSTTPPTTPSGGPTSAARHRPARRPSGTPSGGQFAASQHTEAAIRLAARPDPRPGQGPTLEDLHLPSWGAPSDTGDPVGSFSRCKEVSAEYTEFLHAHGIEAEWVQVCGPTGDFPDALDQWKGIGQEYWQHYVTRVHGPDGDYYVDFTARQFDPAAAHPQITPVDGADWAETYPLPRRVLDDWLASWPAETRADDARDRQVTGRR